MLNTYLLNLSGLTADFVAAEEIDCTDDETEACYTGSPATRGVGECQDGERTCASGEWSACTVKRK